MVKDMFECPRCEKPSISLLRKAILSPGQIANCNSCNASLGVRYPSWLTAMIPGTILMIVAMFVNSESAEWLLNGIGLALMIILPLLFTPLHKEE